MLIVSEPLFSVKWRSSFSSPVGHEELFQNVLQEANNMSAVAECLLVEYKSLLRALGDMGVEYRIAVRASHSNQLDENFLLPLCKEFGCRFVGMPDFPAGASLYPRDFSTVLSGITLVSPRNVVTLAPSNNGSQLVLSPFGEGGTILYTERSALVGDLILENDSVKDRPTTTSDIAVLHEAGLVVGKLPVAESARFSYGPGVTGVSINYHLDRIACLITGVDGRDHLIVDPKAVPVRRQESGWIALDKSYEAACRPVCEELDIMLHSPETMTVPYALNLLQLPDRRILMTSGDEAVYALVSDLVGEENITITDVPIRYFPVWSYAGIRCLISEMPHAVMKKV